MHKPASTCMPVPLTTLCCLLPVYRFIYLLFDLCTISAHVVLTPTTFADAFTPTDSKNVACA